LSAAVLALPRRDGVGDGQDRGPNHGGTLLAPGSGPQEPCHTRARYVTAVKRERGNLACLLGRTATKGPASSGGIETLKIHEYQAKELLAPFGVAVPLGRSATTVEEAVAAVGPLVQETGNPVVVLKSQIHAGGRGKGTFKEHEGLRGGNVVLDGRDGGVEAAEAKVRDLASGMLGSTLVTIQTGPEGKQVNRLYVEQGMAIATELYLSVVLDRSL